MGFIAHMIDDGQEQPFETMPAAAGLALTVGTALCITGGKLALAVGETSPSYFSAVELAATAAGESVTVTRVAKKIIYETKLAVANTAIAIGAKYTIHSDGNGITATATNGVAEIISFDGTAAGSTVRVRF
ncbi:MAG: hypothetical protein RSA62_03590 [Oscillospiraceae bacterium]